MKIACIGEIIFDCFPDFNRLGGAPGNVAVMLKQLGCESAIISAVGRDSLGEDALAQLRKFGVDLSFVQKNDHPTGLVRVTLNEKGGPSYDFPSDSAYDYLAWNDRLAAAVSSFDAVCFGTLAQRGKAGPVIREFVRRTRPDALRVLDLNLRAPFYDEKTVLESLQLANVLKLNDEELPVLAEMLKLSPADAIPYLLNRQVRLVALSMGKAGARLYSADETDDCPAAPVEKIVDTVGAGDSYTAVLIAGLLRHEPLNLINRLANQVAAFVCSSSGATPVLPGYLDVLRLCGQTGEEALFEKSSQRGENGIF